MDSTSTACFPSCTVLIVDDFKPLRTFMVLALRQKPDLKVSEASDGLEAIEYTKGRGPDLILLDIGLPGLDGISAGREIRKLSPHSKILFISAIDSIDVVQEALSIGAQGYLVKSGLAGELLLAVDQVLQGKQYISPRLNLG